MPEPTPLGIGLIGAGVMGRKHARIVEASADAEIVAVADPVAPALASELGVRAFSDEHALLESGLVEAVIVASPNALHVRTALACLDRGIPVLVEKPVATSSAAAAELIERAEASTSPVLVGHHRRHHPAVRAAAAAIADGGIGRPISIAGQWLTRKSDDYFNEEWRRRRGAGVLLVNLVHDIDLFRCLLGEIRAVQAVASSAARGFEVEDTAALVVEFDNGALGTLIGSDSAVSPWTWDQATRDDPSFPFDPDALSYTVTGTQGALAIPTLVHYRGAGDWHRPLTRTELPAVGPDSYAAQFAHFVAVARGTQEPLVTVRDAAATLAVLEAAQEAASTRRRVVVDQSVTDSTWGGAS